MATSLRHPLFDVERPLLAQLAEQGLVSSAQLAGPPRTRPPRAAGVAWGGGAAMAEPDAIIADYVAAWNATQPTERRALLERSVSADVRVTEPPADLEGVAALEGRI